MTTPSASFESLTPGSIDKERLDAGMDVFLRRPSVAERRAAGKTARQESPRSSHACWTPPADRRDPIALLRGQDRSRRAALVPIRWGRMSASAFTYFRGSAGVMAMDLASSPHTGLTVQLCGDAHISNFGLFASPERTLLFDVNDFDETLPGPFEWDVKRLAASAVIAARANGFAEAVGREAALAAVRSYRERMSSYAEMGDLEIWYSRVSVDDLLAVADTLKTPLSRGGRSRTLAVAAKARTHDSLQALSKLTTVVDGRVCIIHDPPLLFRVRLDDNETRGLAERAFADYSRSIEDDRRALIERYTLDDVGHKVVGVGSVGTMCLIALLTGRDSSDPLFLQIKEAGPSVLEQYLGRSRYDNNGQRVVAGQRLMQAASDIFLGWTRAPGEHPRDFYWRQLRDMKGSAAIADLRPAGLPLYCAACGWTLARAHARSGDAIAISAYLGASEKFDSSITDFSASYADQMERDFELLTRAVAAGEIETSTGL